MEGKVAGGLKPLFLPSKSTSAELYFFEKDQNTLNRMLSHQHFEQNQATHVCFTCLRLNIFVLWLKYSNPVPAPPHPCFQRFYIQVTSPPHPNYTVLALPLATITTLKMCKQVIKALLSQSKICIKEVTALDRICTCAHT